MKHPGLIAVALAAAVGALSFEACTSHLPLPLEADGGPNAGEAADVAAPDGEGDALAAEAGGDSSTVDATTVDASDGGAVDATTVDAPDAGALDATMDALVDVTAQ
jgi:hypothetical protein